jgi:hypothetical protein
MPPDTTSIEWVPAVVDDDLLPDMGRIDTVAHVT